MEANWNKVGKAVTKFLADTGMQQKELAAASGLSTAIIREIQAGKPRRRRPQTWQSLSRALGQADNYLADMLRGRQSSSEPPAPEPANGASLEFLAKLVSVLEQKLGHVVDVIYNSDEAVDITIAIRHSSREH